MQVENKFTRIILKYCIIIK